MEKMLFLVITTKAIVGVGNIDVFDDFIDMMDSLNLDSDEKMKESNEASSSGTKDDDQASIKETTQEEQGDIPKDWRIVKDHPLDNVIGEITKG
ncbi:hypothetical protein PIB30_103623, partial [Stylosanthes scabra]|nr:hypothetical protein [Stylosanthes scabra]